MSNVARLWWCAMKQAWVANPCVCNDYDILKPCGWVQVWFASKGKTAVGVDDA